MDESAAEGIVQCDDDESEDQMFQCVREVTPGEAAAGVFHITDVVLPLPGSRVIYSERLKMFYDNMCKADGVQLVGFAHAVREYSFGYLTGAYRRLLIKPDKVDFGFINYSDPKIDLTETDLVRLHTYPRFVSEQDGCVNIFPPTQGNPNCVQSIFFALTLTHVSDCTKAKIRE